MKLNDYRDDLLRLNYCGVEFDNIYFITILTQGVSIDLSITKCGTEHLATNKTLVKTATWEMSAI